MTADLVAERTRRFDAVLGAYDLRGRIGSELDEDLLFSLGFGTAQSFAASHGAERIVIGSDMRPDSPRFAAAAAAGVAAAGLEPVVLGLCSTDQLYFASGALDLPGLMVTASHNPAEWNGIKVCGAAAAGISRSSGLLDIRDRAIAAPADTGYRPVADETAAAEVARTYAARLRELTGLGASAPRRLTVVADCGNGMAGKLLGEVFGTAAGLEAVDCELIGLYTELDGTFPNHPANPLVPENLEDVRAAVRDRGADLGLAFDGDADRCFFIDERGEVMSASAVGALVAAREIARAQSEGEAEPVVLHNLITSRSVAETVEAAGGRAVRTPVGHSGIKQLMRTHDGVFACEHSAHFYFRDFYGADSGMLAACHLIRVLASSDQPASELVASYERYAASGEINSSVDDPDEVIARVAAAMRAGEFGGGEVDEFDGVSLEGADFWCNVRKSNTEPLVRLNCETPDAARTQRLADSLLTLIRA